MAEGLQRGKGKKPRLRTEGKESGAPPFKKNKWGSKRRKIGWSPQKRGKKVTNTGGKEGKE